MTNDNQSYVEHHPHGGTSFVGPDATNLFRARVMASALRLYGSTGIKANRAYTPSAMLRVATEYTGKTYKVSRAECLRAAADVHEWAETMNAAIPHLEGGKQV